MTFLNAEEKNKLAAAIQYAESGTRGEIVTVVAQRSDNYRYIPLLWASLAALIFPGCFFLWSAIEARGWVAPADSVSAFGQIYAWQILIFLGLGMVFQISAIKMRLIPRSVQRHRAARHAREQFFLNNLHETAERSGLLIFVSIDERYVEILADSGIAQQVDNEQWHTIVADFTRHVSSGQIAVGFEQAVEACRQVLWTHFPASSAQNPNELTNHLIEVDEP